MRVLETKTLRLKNNEKEINEANAKQAKFFWNVQNVQVTHVETVETEYAERNKDDPSKIDVTNHTYTTEYATVTYERDKLMPHYDEVVALEQELTNLEKNIPEKQKEAAKNFSVEDWNPLCKKLDGHKVNMQWGIFFLIVASCAVVTLPITVVLIYRLWDKRKGCKLMWEDQLEKSRRAFEEQKELLRAEIQNMEVQQADAEVRLRELTGRVLAAMRSSY